MKKTQITPRIFIRQTQSFGSLLFVLFGFLICNAQPHTQKEYGGVVLPLESGQTIEREIAPQQRHRYKVKLNVGEYVKIEITQQGCETVPILKSPDTQNLTGIKTQPTGDGIQTVTAAAEVAGDYELHIITFQEPNTTGKYIVKISEIRRATDKELNFTAGMKLFNQVTNAAMSRISTAEMMQENIAIANRAIEKFQAAKAARQEGATLHEIGRIYQKLGNPTKAIEYHRLSVERFRAAGYKRGEAGALNELGLAYSYIGEWQQAFDSLFEALASRREDRHLPGEADALDNIGNVYARIGDLERAAIYHAQALEIYRKGNVNQAVSLNYLGKIFYAGGEYRKAQEHFQEAVAVARQAKNRRSEANFLSNLGRTYFALGDREKSFNHFDESLAISRSLNDVVGEAATLKHLGQIHLALGENDKAAEYFNQSLMKFRSIEDVEETAQTLLGLAKAESRKGNSESAQIKTEEAINLIEKIRARVNVAGLRDTFSAKLQDFYGFYVELLMQRDKLAPDKNYAALALQANERARARGLLNLLAESNADVRQGVDAKLLDKEIELRNLLSARMENLTRILSGKHTPE